MSHAFDLPVTGARSAREVSCLLVMEPGSRWPRWLAPHSLSSLVLPGPREPVDQLASRAISAIHHLSSTGGALRSVVIAAGEGSDEGIFAARCMIFRAAILSMPRRKPGLLVFAGHRGLEAAARHELLSLAGALTQELGSSRIAIRVKLEDELEEPS
jgi:hypothetical protein